ncbi:MAG: patatin [Pseudopedobacter saltans]|uniref:Patatin n=1 Tax=Pseudopedobacter saltans TaxID=151895 RepID=A0A2W5FEP6_9SPHI|nr:MAG: patatin [Pseudopedobacter saltans]
MRNIGYCLSGGGVRGLAHLGAMKALEEKGIKPSIISGTSVGAMMGAFYAAGFTPDEILEVSLRSRFLTSGALQWRKAGFFNMTFFRKLFQLIFPRNSFEALKIPLIVAATNVITGEIEYFEKGELVNVLLASACVPLVFQPVEMKGAIYMDGGVLDNFPVGQLWGRCDRIVGSYVNDMDLTTRKIKMSTIIDRTFNLAINDTINIKKQVCDVFFSPHDMMRYGIMDMKNANAIFNEGYKNAISQLTDEIVKKLIA